MKTYTKNFLISLGAHCTFLGFTGIIMIIFTGIFCYYCGLSTSVFYVLLGLLFTASLLASIYNLKCNSSIFKRK
jgi:hypothetical protein